MGAATDRTADQEEKELRDAFRVIISFNNNQFNMVSYIKEGMQAKSI